MNYPQRKHIRLKEYDYSQNGCYFATVCVKGRRSLLGTPVVGRDAHIPPQIKLSEMGEVVEWYILNINRAYRGVTVDKYVVMPNHIHLLLTFDHGESGGMWASRPTLQTVIRSLKTMVTKQLGQSIWQDSFYEHIIRNEDSYQQIWRYIDENPARWAEDEYNIYNV